MSRPHHSRRAFLRHSLAVSAGLGVGQALSVRKTPAAETKTPDVLIIGGGAIGATTAYYLAIEGLKVVLVDQGRAGQEASWASAGMIQPSGSGQSRAWSARSSLLSRQLYDALDGELAEATGRRIGYGGEGGLILALDETEAAYLERLADAQAGDEYPAVILDRAAVREREPGVAEQVVAAVLLPGHRFLDARKFTEVMLQAAQKQGVTVREGFPISGLLREQGKVVGAQSREEKFSAGLVINAAGAWAGRIDAQLALPIKPVHGQILSIQGPDGGLRHNLQRLSAAGYATPRADGRVLVGATSDDYGYEKKVTSSGLRALTAMVRDLLPHSTDQPVLDSWSGLRPGTPDGLPAIGPDPRVQGGYLWAAGHGGYGMMQAPATAKVLTDLVLQRPARLPIDSVRPERLLH